jgi:hypothetical protein
LKSIRSLFIFGICVLSVMATASDAAYAVEFSMTNATSQQVDVYVDGAKRCSLAPSAARDHYCSLEVSRGRHKISVIRDDGWQQSGTFNITDEYRCAVESEVTCCCKDIKGIEDLF